MIGIVGRDLAGRLAGDMASLAPPGVVSQVTDAELDGLPEPVQRYLRFAGVVGRPAVMSLRAHLRGRFRLRRGQRFAPADIWQYNTVAPIARVFWMRIDLWGVLPMVGRDSYLQGRGRMIGRLLDMITVADGQGDEFDIGELTTWLDDAILLAPSMLLRAPVSFRAVDADSFDVTLADAGRIVGAHVRVDERGAPLDVSSDDRYADLPGGLVRARWSTPVAGWQTVDGRAVPTAGAAIWHLPDGDFTYAELDLAPDSVEVNPVVVPTRPRPRRAGEGWYDAVEGAAAIAVTLAGSPVLRGRYNRWGATEGECRAAMPGDDLVPEPRLQSTRAVTIEARPRAVWSWLAQIGQGRGGLYSYDALENLLRLDIHSADAVLPEHQQLEPGDLVRLGRPGSPCFRVASVDTGTSLVLVSADPVTEAAVPTPVEDGTGATWQWQLLSVRGGTATRLVSRQRNAHPSRDRWLWRLVEPIGFVMERRMLLGIKERAEGQVALA